MRFFSSWILFFIIEFFFLKTNSNLRPIFFSKKIKTKHLFQNYYSKICYDRKDNVFATPPPKRDGTISSYVDMSCENQFDKGQKRKVADDMENDGKKEGETIEVYSSPDDESKEEYSIEEDVDENHIGSEGVESGASDSSGSEYDSEIMEDDEENDEESSEEVNTEEEHLKMEEVQEDKEADGDDGMDDGALEENEAVEEENENGKTSEDSDDDEEDDSFYRNDVEDVAAQREAYALMNGNAIPITVSLPLSDGERNFYVINFGDMIWYNQSTLFKIVMKTNFKNAGRAIPCSIDKLDEHKLRVEYSLSNEMVIPRNKTYPKTRWMTVIATSLINPKRELESELKKLSKHIKKIYSSDTGISIGQRWMEYALSSGNTRILDTMKGYMGNDNDVVQERVNTELMELGNKPHQYVFDETLDKFLPDWYIKKFLQDYFNATKWDDVNKDNKAACYKGYPKRELPDWNKIRP